MLKINNIKFNRIKIPLLLMLVGFGGFFLYQYLTFIPDYSSAKSISTDVPVTITPTTPVTKWEDLEYMQQMTLEACNSVPTPAAKNGNTINTNVPTKQLKDSRDGKWYWVAKLADGNCWMTQNLDLDLNGVTLKPESSNVSSDWKSTTGASTTSGYAPSGHYSARYYDPGYKYCTTSSCTATTSSNYGHDHQGNLYSWAAATAGTGTSSVTSGNVSSSICPKGWQLPTSNNTNTYNKSFGGLTTAYGIISGSDVGYDTAAILRAAPLYFVKSGGLPFIKDVSLAGSHGLYWSSTARSDTYAYNLIFYNDTYSGVATSSPSGSTFRYMGLAVRCVAKDISASSTPSEPTSGIDSPDISVTVPNIITLNVSDSVNIETKTNNISEGSFTASVSSNTPYSIVLSTTNDGHTDLRNENGSGAIPTLTSSQALAPGISAWGIKCTNPANFTNCIQTSYIGLTDYLNPTLFFKSTTGGLNLPATFQIGIAVSPDLPSGTYTTDILVTAATAD